MVSSGSPADNRVLDPKKKKFDYSPTSLETPKEQRSFRQRRERVLKVIECAKRTSGLSAETAHIERPGSL